MCVKKISKYLKQKFECSLEEPVSFLFIYLVPDAGKTF